MTKHERKPVYSKVKAVGAASSMATPLAVILAWGIRSQFQEVPLEVVDAITALVVAASGTVAGYLKRETVR